MNSELQVEYRPLDALIPYIRNARTHSDDQVAQIAASIQEFGWTNPVLVDGRNGIIAGHGRVLAARKLGLEAVPVIELDHLTETQKRAYVLADNRLAENAGWDQSLLSLELGELQALNFDLTLTGFAEGELDELLGRPVREGLVDDDAAPQVPKVPVSRKDDLWLLGEHRVLCGDSSDPRVVEQLMAGATADLIFTDPPYGVSYGGGRAMGSTRKGARVKAHGPILGDDKRGAELIGFLSGAFAAASGNVKAGAAWYVCCPWRTLDAFQAALGIVGLEVSACIVWDKGSIGLGRNHYRPQHEFILYVRGGSWFGGKAESDIWTLPRDASSSYVHPTQKPVGLIERALANSSKSGDLVLDPFGGAGSTLIAAEKRGRIARVIDLDPKYVDVIVTRWQQWSGETAVHDGTGHSFETLAAVREGEKQGHQDHAPAACNERHDACAIEV